MKRTLLLLAGIMGFLSAFPQRELSQILDSALKTGNRRIILPKAEYILKLEDAKPLLLQDLQDITIDGSGSMVTCLRPTQAVQISNCTNLRLTGFSFDYDPLPFVQGVITDLDEAAGTWITIQIDPGFETDGLDCELPDRLQVFLPSVPKLKDNLYTYWRNDFTRMERVSDRVFKIVHTQSHKGDNVEVGDRVVFSTDTDLPARPHAIVLNSCTNMRLEDLTVFASNCFGFFEQECSANSYYRCRVTRREPRPGQTGVRLRSTNADAFHSKSAGRGPLIEACVFQYQGDDGIAINGSFYELVSLDDSSITVVSDHGLPRMRIGDRLQVVDSSGSRVATATLSAMQAIDRAVPQSVDARSAGTPGRNASNREYRLFFGKVTPGLHPGMLVYPVDRIGSGFQVIHDTVGFTRARGILVKASDGIISGNLVEECELAAIVAAPEYNWMEAGPSTNLLITGNTIRHCMFANSRYGIEQAAPISVLSLNRFHRFSDFGAHQNIFILNNTITQSPWPGIMATSIRSGLISGNAIQVPGGFARTHGSGFGVDNDRSIWTLNTDGLLIFRNAVITR